jgi:hypothetical protein
VETEVDAADGATGRNMIPAICRLVMDSVMPKGVEHALADWLSLATKPTLNEGARSMLIDLILAAVLVPGVLLLIVMAQLVLIVRPLEILERQRK